MRALGIDYGSKRIGLALSDETGLLAQGLPTLVRESDAQVLQALRKLVEERAVTEIVVGLPRNMDGSLGQQAQQTMMFAESLKAFGLAVHLVDERLTTERARRTMVDAGLSRAKQRRRVDGLAARFILQLYLDSARWKTTD